MYFSGCIARVGYSAWHENNCHALTQFVFRRVSPTPARRFRHHRCEVSAINGLRSTIFVAAPDPLLMEEHAVDL